MSGVCMLTINTFFIFRIFSSELFSFCAYNFSNCLTNSGFDKIFSFRNVSSNLVFEANSVRVPPLFNCFPLFLVLLPEVLTYLLDFVPPDLVSLERLPIVIYIYILFFHK